MASGGGPGLSQVFRTLETPYKLVSPYSGLRGEAAMRVLEVAVAVAQVETYPENSAEKVATPRFDPVWNRYRGVYESKTSLLLPPTGCYRFVLSWPEHSTLTFHTALLPAGGGKAAVDFVLRLQNQVVWSFRQNAANRWQRHEMSLSGPTVGSALELCAHSDGAPLGVPVLGEPTIWAMGAGAFGPNLLLIIVDTLRADALSAMPGVQKWAQKGALFSQAITSATWTRPALLSLLGGDLPSAIGQNAEDMIPKERDRQRFYALDRKLLPRVLREAGMKVAAIGNNFFLLGYPQIGLSLGFDEVADVRHPVQDTPAITRAARRFLAENRQRSFFLQLHYDAPHWPYSPPPQYENAALAVPAAKLAGRLDGQAPTAVSEPAAQSYLAEAAYADAQIALVLAEVERLGLASRTLVVIVGDHGEVFDPHHNHYVLALKQPTLYHHGWSAYDEILRVPMVLAMPGRLPQGVAVSEQVRLFDVAPTVLEALGLWEKRVLLPGGSLQQSLSLVPLWRGEKETQERPAFVEGQNVRALRLGGWLYLRRSDPRLRPLEKATTLWQIPEELYDLRADPLQHQNLLADNRSPDVQRALQNMRTLFSQHAPRLPDAKLPVTHLALAPVPSNRLLRGLVKSSDLQLAVAGVRLGEVTPLRAGQLEIQLQPGGQLDLHIDPEATIDLQLTMDGLPLDRTQLLIGPYSLPLLANWPPMAAAGETGNSDGADLPNLTLYGPVLGRLFAAYPPVLGERGDVLLWRDQPSPGAVATSLSRGGAFTQSEVATVMRDWGYAQPDPNETAKKPPATDKTVPPPSVLPPK